MIAWERRSTGPLPPSKRSDSQAVSANESSRARHRPIRRDAIDDARTNEFTVAEDLSVAEVRYRFVARERESRESMADDHAADIRHFAANLVALDRDIAHRLRATMSGIGAPIYSV